MGSTLKFCRPSIHKQFNPSEVPTVVGCKIQNILRYLVRCAWFARRNSFRKFSQVRFAAVYISNSDPLTSLSSSTKDITALATSAKVLGLTNEAPLDFVFER